MFDFNYDIKCWIIRKYNVEKFIEDNKILEKINELTIENTVPRKIDKDGNVLEWYVRGDEELRQLQFLVQKLYNYILYAYDKDALNFYTVECNTPNTGVRFYNYLDEGKEFDELLDWSIGIKNLYIKNTSNYNNETIYDISYLEYSNKEILAEYINLQDSYTVSNNNTIYTEQYIVIPPEGMSVQYKKYDGTAETETLLKTEMITIDKTMFKKLNYSNIDKITYIGNSSPDKGDPSSDIKYTLLKDEGIIVWNEVLPEGLNIYVQYTINKPVALVFDLDLL